MLPSDGFGSAPQAQVLLLGQGLRGLGEQAAGLLALLFNGPLGACHEKSRVLVTQEKAKGTR